MNTCTHMGGFDVSGSRKKRSEIGSARNINWGTGSSAEDASGSPTADNFIYKLMARTKHLPLPKGKLVHVGGVKNVLMVKRRRTIGEVRIKRGEIPARIVLNTATVIE